MANNWDIYSRQGLDLALSVSTVGFSAARFSTHLGFSIARGVASSTIGAATAVLDHAVFGGCSVSRPVGGKVVATVLTMAEQIALAPIQISEYITSSSLQAAHSSINAVSVVFPGSSDASFSLASFIELAQKEWNQTGADEPERRFTVTQAARGMVGWITLQGITQEWQEAQWLKHVREIDVREPPIPTWAAAPAPKSSRVHVTSDVIVPGEQGQQIIAAEIGEPGSPKPQSPSPEFSKSRSSSILRSRPLSLTISRNSRAVPPGGPCHDTELKSNLRRLSKMVLAGYGGATLFFFGVSPSIFMKSKVNKASMPVPTCEASAMANEKTSEEATLAYAVDEAEAADAANSDGLPPPPEPSPTSQEFSWWDLMMGKHDEELFNIAHNAHEEYSEEDAIRKANATRMKAEAVFRDEYLMPRFWVLTDHNRKQVVLVIRGTMSLNELAVDLTCEPVAFHPAKTDAETDDTLPRGFSLPNFRHKNSKEHEGSDSENSAYLVHGGMLRMAKAMGDVGNPVHMTVLSALQKNPTYDLVLCGHSLGAGVATLLGMMWADPETCKTVKSGGLPAGRSVRVYAFAPPCLTDTVLARITYKLVVSVIYSNDIVSRLSHGSLRDLKTASLWLCEAEENGSGEGWSAITERAQQWKDGKGTQEDMDWFISIRKTLEASMQNANLYPPGRVLWAMRDSDMHPVHQRFPQPPEPTKGYGPDKLRVYEVLDVEKVFSQLVFARNMLSAHLAHQYDEVIHGLL